MFKAIVFDLDGTLLDTLEDLADSMNSVLSSCGFPTHPADIYKEFVGEGVEYLVSRALPEEERDPKKIRDYIQEMRREYEKHWNQKTRPYDGISNLLDRLVRLNLKLSILSNKPHDFTVKMVQYFLPLWVFSPVLGAKEDAPKKPDPFSALRITQVLKVQPRECLYLGDTKIDMQTARAAGMYAVGALWGFRSRDELLSSGAQALISHPMVMLDLLTRGVQIRDP